MVLKEILQEKLNVISQVKLNIVNQYFSKKCKTVKTKHGCTRVKCCEFEKKGSKVSKLKCRFVTKKSCPEVKISKCHLSVTGPSCKREKCCIYSKIEDKLLKLSCTFKGEEKCVETLYVQCHIKKNQNSLYSTKMLYLW